MSCRLVVIGKDWHFAWADGTTDIWPDDWQTGAPTLVVSNSGGESMQRMMNGLCWLVAGLTFFAVFGVIKFIEIVWWLIQHVKVVG